MKAHVLYGINDLKYEELERPVPGKGEVLLKVEAVGICGSDIPRIYKTGAHTHPLIPGHEFAGTVCEVGEGTEALYSGDNISLIGRRMGVFPLIPCGVCGPCRNKQFEMCRNYNYLGSRCDGGFAEYVTVPVRNLIELPDNVSFDDAAMLEPAAVSVHAMRRMSGDVNIQGSPVVVIGLGTIGLLLTMNLINEGFKNLYVVGNKVFQRNKALELGIKPDNYCDSTKGNVVDWILEKTDGVGAAYIFECVGTNDTYCKAVEMAAPAGSIMLVGNPASDMTLEKSIYWKILRNQLVIKGTWNSSFTGEQNDDWHYAINRMDEGRIRPSQLISHRYSLNKLQDGLSIMRDKTEDYVKIMIHPHGDK
ncbi:MAG: galactitol-1-phosphate 5-dehydrogenase [Lachnospiraceae bacterium]|nr:galactitol-1-phosphate 5-dehydrogenase [Lachnospiraceae bacterium]